MADIYRVLSQQQVQELTPDARFVDVMEIAFEVVPIGQTGRVRVPLSQYTPETVDRAIRDQAERMIAVHEL